MSVFLICLATATLEKNRQEKHTYLSFLSVFFSSALLRLHWRKANKKKKTYSSLSSVFLFCLAMATLEINRQEKKHLFIFLVCFSNMACYGNIGEKQTRKKKTAYLSFSSVFLVCLATATLGKNTPIYLYSLFFSSALLRLHWRKIDKKKNTYLSFLSVFLICIATATLEKNRQEKKTTPIYLSCLFFSSALLRLHWRKIDKKNTPIDLSCRFFLICIATATLEKTRQEKCTYLSFLSVFSHLPSYGYIGEK